MFHSQARFQLGWILTLVVLLASCGPPTDLPPPQSEETARGTDGYVGLELRIDRKILKTGDVAHIRFNVTSRIKDVMIYESKDKPVLDIEITRTSGLEVLTTWSRQNPDKVLHRLELKPDETRTLDMTWTVPDNITWGSVGVGGVLYQDGKLVAGAPAIVCINSCW
jgi:hypothetical protein